jgi:hypothetical protein
MYPKLASKGILDFRLPPYNPSGERMAATSWNPSSFCFVIFLFFPLGISRTSLRASWWDLVRGQDDRAEARPCMNLHGMYRWFGVVPQGLFELFPIFPFWWFSEPFLGDFLIVILRPFSLGFGGGCMHEPLVVLFPFDSPPKSVRKGARFWGFLGSRVRSVLGGIPQFLLI